MLKGHGFFLMAPRLRKDDKSLRFVYFMEYCLVLACPEEVSESGFLGYWLFRQVRSFRVIAF